MNKPLILSGDLPLVVDFNEKGKAGKLGAKPFYMEGKFSCWIAPKGIDVLPLKEYWNLEFREYYKKEIGEDVQENEKEKGIRLSHLLFSVKGKLKELLPEKYWVKAEIVNISGSNHKYLELADYDDKGNELAKSRASIFSGKKSIIINFEKTTGMKLKGGMKVLVLVSVEFHEKFGFSLNIFDIDSRFTIGDMEAKLIKIKRDLNDLRIFSNNKVIAHPFDYSRVAVIAPDSAAGLGDFKTKSDLLEKNNLCSFKFFKATFQGREMIPTLSKALDDVNREILLGGHYDAVVIIRGGGDKAGLYALNELEIAKRVCLMPIPVIVGIGHERDITILDEVACIRQATPSMVITNIYDTIIKNSVTAKRNVQLIKKLGFDCISNARLSLDSLSGRKESEVKRIIQAGRTDIESNKKSMFSSAQLMSRSARHEAKEQVSKIVFYDPSKVINRGYSLIRNEENKVTGGVKSLSVGSDIKIEMRDGSINATIKKIEEQYNEQ